MVLRKTGNQMHTEFMRNCFLADLRVEQPLL